MEDNRPTSPDRIQEPIYQYSLFEETGREAIVNVASVPQRSPFRYPGGKTWFVPRFRRWLASQSRRPSELVEPFAGGGILSLTAVFENWVDRVTMIELDADVAAVWQTVLSEEAGWLAHRIATFAFSEETVQEALGRACSTTREKAFQTLLRNRVNRGGILAPGSGRLKQGENGKGLASRWYPQTLKKRILNITTVADRICFLQADGLEALEHYVSRPDAVFFLDPPYTAAGKKAGSRLYRHNDLDHERLFSIVSALPGDFIMTYDNADGVRDLARQYGFDTLAIPMKNTHHAEMTELLIGRDLRWA